MRLQKFTRMNRRSRCKPTLPNLAVWCCVLIVVVKFFSTVSYWAGFGRSDFRLPDVQTVMPSAANAARPQQGEAPGVVLTVAVNATDDASSAWRNYIDLHDRLTSAPLPEDHRFVIADLSGGFGTRLLSVASAMLFGMLTDRAVILQGWKEYDESLTLPFRTYLHENIAEHHKSKSTKELRMIDWCLYFDGSRDRDRGAVSLRLDDYNQMWSQRVVLIGTNCPPYRWMLHNTLYHRRIAEIFAPRSLEELTGFDILGFFERRIGISARFRTKFNALLAEYRGLDKTNVVIGLQIRTGPSDFEPGSESTNAYLEDNDVDNMVACAQHLAQYKNNVVYFVAADMDAVVDRVRTQLGEQMRVVGNDVGNTERMLLNSYLLSSSDALIITAGSTFGSTAAARSGRAPLVVGRGSTACSLADLQASPSHEPEPARSPAAVW
eukprot:TRINITY_DN10782_c0_g1_i1.p1 TRINITY_DN10782_c0_g1~~TRINITY_DN10782_c0_g1_i1.p1  ORF type:complete len:436 (-),score=130.07 TRINITY_DN10782_c0_g1_i1:595-1902(-)